MNTMIYINDKDELKAYGNASIKDFETFKASDAIKIVLLYNNKQINETPEEFKDVYPTFLRSCLKMWSSSHTFNVPNRAGLKTEE